MKLPFRPISTLLFACLWLAALARIGCAETSPLPPRPNIVFVLTDDQGYGDLGCTGNPVVRTPRIDAFHAQSIRFTEFHASPTCAPTRSALMTGRHEFRNGVTHTIFERERLTLRAVTLAQVLRRAGYTTGIFGKWHLGDEAPYQPDRRGFDEVFIHGAGGIGQSYAGSCGDAPNNSYFNPAILHNGRFVRTSGYCTDVFFDQALRWIDQRRRRPEPFFAYIALNAPHAPLDCPPEYRRRHEGKVSDLAARFYGMIENIDDNFGRLTDALAAWGLERNTLVIFMTDNGGTVGVDLHNDGRRGAKGTPYEGGIRVPSFWRWPALGPGGLDCAALTAHLDVLPTLAEIAGARLDARVARQIEGRSLVPLLRNPDAPWPDRLLVTHVGRWPRGHAAQARYSQCSIRNGRYALVNNLELYDLALDRGQRSNIIDTQPAIAAELRAAYDAWWDSVQPALVNELVTPPKVNAFKARYWKQFGGGPDEALRKVMAPDSP